MPTGHGWYVVLGLALLACGESESGPEGTSTGATGGLGGTGAAGGQGGAAASGGPGGSGAAGGGGAGGEAGSGAAGGGQLIDGFPVSPLYGRIVFNEVLTDGTTEGDPNGDGDIDPVEDQFVELVHVGTQALGLEGFTLIERDLTGAPRHTFGPSDSVAPDAAMVVFGGGDCPDPTATTTFYVANAADPGLPFGLDLSVPMDTMWLLDADAQLVARFCYGASAECGLAAATDQSLTRSPDVTGDFVPHATASGANGAPFSVGTRVNGTPF